MRNPVMYVILNGELKMSPGKAAAQAVHAAMMLQSRYRDTFLENYRRTVLVLEASSFEQFYGISDYLGEANIEHEYYVDEGVNEVNPFSATALAVEPIDADDTEKREIFASLPLYGGNITIKHFDGWFESDEVIVSHNTEINSRFVFNKIKKAVK